MVLSGGFCPAIIPTHNPKLISAFVLKRCYSAMAQTTMAHASMASPLCRMCGLAHSGMARRSSMAQFRCVSVWRIPVWLRSSTAHFSMVQFRRGASKHRPKRAVPHATCHLYHQNKIFQLNVTLHKLKH